MKTVILTAEEKSAILEMLSFKSKNTERSSISSSIVEFLQSEKKSGKKEVLVLAKEFKLPNFENCYSSLKTLYKKTTGELPALWAYGQDEKKIKHALQVVF
jgi:hypothetical protein